MKTWQQPLPEIYQQLSEAELHLRIESARQALGDRLIILGHHYQQDGIIEFADFTGDSFELSRKAAEQKGIDYVVFCGVHFMAESADILTEENVRVILPDLGAGCSMADMANIDQTIECWEQLKEHCPGQTIVPITYMNSSAAIKAFVGEHGGAVCTSSNCRNVLEWALGGGAESPGLGEGPGFRVQGSGAEKRSEVRDQRSRVDEGSEVGGQRSGKALGESDAVSGDVRSLPFLNPEPRTLNPEPQTLNPLPNKVKILFFPDQHLGRNTAYAMGYPLDRMVVWDPQQELGGNDLRRLQDSDFVLWKGHCSVHALFRPEHIDQARQQYPGIKVIVHPECKWEVVRKADMAGSTAYIVKQIEAAPPGSQWAIGTEVHLVNRLKNDHPEQKIIVLSDCQCLCTTMYRIDLPHLCWVLESLLEGKVVNPIKVDAQTRKWALVALGRMLAIKGTGSSTSPGQPGAHSLIVSQEEAIRMGVVD